MKLLVLLACVCALAAGESAGESVNVPSAAQLKVGLQHLYRRFLYTLAPKQLELQDALDIQYRNGMMAGPPFKSPVKGTYDGVEAPTFSYVNSLITPGQKGFFGMWTLHDTSDLLVTYHYGTLTKVHMITDGGIHKEAILGNPLRHPDAKFVVMVPKKTYCIFESMSEDKSSFISYVAIPAWNPANSHNFSQKEMEGKFPDFSNMFAELSKQGVAHGSERFDDDEEDDHDHDDHDHEHDHGYERRQRRRFRGRGRTGRRMLKAFRAL